MLFSVSLYFSANAKPAAVWTFDGRNAKDFSGKNINGNFVGKAKAVGGIVKKALKFNGATDGIQFPDSADINTGGPYTNRTVVAFFNCDDVGVTDRKQTIYEEGGKHVVWLPMFTMAKPMLVDGIEPNTLAR